MCLYFPTNHVYHTPSLSASILESYLHVTPDFVRQLGDRFLSMDIILKLVRWCTGNGLSDVI